MINLKNEQDTTNFGKYISGIIENGTIIALVGELGSGKTTLSKSLINSLTDEDDVPSPTFNIVNEYHSKGKTIYHFDFYRLEDENELYGIGFDDYIADKKAVIIIEWANKFYNLLPKNYIKIIFEKLENSRNIDILSIGEKYDDIVVKLADYKNASS